MSLARDLRQNETDAERKLWRALRDRRFAAAKFRRQVAVGPYVADFLSYEHRLIVEVDGGQHAERVEEDLARTQWLESQGFSVVRYWNNEVRGNFEAVLQSLWHRLQPTPLTPTPLPQGERGFELGETAFGLYVHWPFCRSKCPYCDFNSHVREGVDQGRWRAALLAELDHYAAQTAGRELTAIFFGGGTPSLMPPATVAAVVERATRHFRFAPGIEITLEANPTSAEAGAFAGFAAAGVNRLSLGVQALDDASLNFLGRQHSAAEALAAVALARAAVPRCSFDLIYARPGQRPADWAAELRRALDEGAEHLSLYQLTLEENTVFHARARRGELSLPPEPVQAALYEMTQETLERAGLPAYEISNHARPGAECRHNLVYWRAQDYLGIGPGAHGRLTLQGAKWATRQHRAPEAWLAQVERDGHATRTREPLSAHEQAQEALLMGLRLAEGVPLARLDALALSPERLAALSEEGLVLLEDGRLTATPAGRQRLDALLAYLV
jgi:oxygen-independent coproporphyrinogen-3 oxidase